MLLSILFGRNLKMPISMCASTSRPKNEHHSVNLSTSRHSWGKWHTRTRTPIEIPKCGKSKAFWRPVESNDFKLLMRLTGFSKQSQLDTL